MNKCDVEISDVRAFLLVAQSKNMHLLREQTQTLSDIYENNNDNKTFKVCSTVSEKQENRRFYDLLRVKDCIADALDTLEQI